MSPQTQEIVAKEASWPCACPNEHHPTRDRAWCHACAEWCYPEPGMGCVRGELARAEDRVMLLEGALKSLLTAPFDDAWSMPDEQLTEPERFARDLLAKHPKEPE